MDLRIPDLEHLLGTPIPFWLSALCILLGVTELKEASNQGINMVSVVVRCGLMQFFQAPASDFRLPFKGSKGLNLRQPRVVSVRGRNFVCEKDFSEKPCGTGCVMRGNFESKWGSLSRERSLAFFVWLKPLVEEGAGVGATSSTGGRNPKRKTIHQL